MIKFLLLIPFLTYLLSYLYLAIYYKNFNILFTVIHEGGKLNLLETSFYASHFLGHIPVYVVIALFFVGTYKSFFKSKINFNKSKIFYFLLIFLFSTTILSIAHFGVDDTLNFLLQRKQSEDVLVGGSWNLHLPSTVLIVFLLPTYFFVVSWFFRKGNVVLRKSGAAYFKVGLFMLFFLSIIFNPNFFSNIKNIFIDPRYLGHSVRELATFPLTYFPLALYFLLKKEKASENRSHKGIWPVILVSLFIFILGLFYQMFATLNVGIQNVSQPFPVLYLLSSHYFEHFLDSVFFTLFALLIF